MKEKLSVCLVASVCMIALVVSVNAENNWNLIKDKKGIQIYSRPNPGSQIKEFMGTTVMNVGIEVVLGLLRDPGDQPKWMDRCAEGRMVKKFNEFEFIIYNVTDLPWPMSDRDVVIRQSTRVDKKGRVITKFSSTPDDATWVPRSEETVRMMNLKGSWTLESLDINITKVTYVIKTDIGGSIPKWMANYASRFIPFNTLASIKELVKLPEYIEKGNQIRTDFAKLAKEVVRARIRTNAEAIGDKELIGLLQTDDELIKILLSSEGKTKDIVQNRVKNHYHQKDGRWFLKGQ